MKWSEQMRELQSEDEHYNQLMLDTETCDLFINDEWIAYIYDDVDIFKIEKNKLDELIKKYPFFTDLKFLLNCIFAGEGDDFISYSKSNIFRKYNDRYEIYNSSQDATLKIYIK